MHIESHYRRLSCEKCSSEAWNIMEDALLEEKMIKGQNWVKKCTKRSNSLAYSSKSARAEN